MTQKACGLIFYEKISKGYYSIKPLVYVKQTDSLVYETSCASGSVALMLSKRIKKITVKQPSGFDLELDIGKKGVVAKGEVGNVTTLSITV